MKTNSLVAISTPPPPTPPPSIQPPTPMSHTFTLTTTVPTTAISTATTQLFCHPSAAAPNLGESSSSSTTQPTQVAMRTSGSGGSSLISTSVVAVSDGRAEGGGNSGGEELGGHTLSSLPLATVPCADTTTLLSNLFQDSVTEGFIDFAEMNGQQGVLTPVSSVFPGSVFSTSSPQYPTNFNSNSYPVLRTPVYSIGGDSTSAVYSTGTESTNNAVYSSSTEGSGVYTTENAATHHHHHVFVDRDNSTAVFAGAGAIEFPAGEEFSTSATHREEFSASATHREEFSTSATHREEFSTPSSHVYSDIVRDLDVQELACISIQQIKSIEIPRPSVPATPKISQIRRKSADPERPDKRLKRAQDTTANRLQVVWSTWANQLRHNRQTSSWKDITILGQSEEGTNRLSEVRCHKLMLAACSPIISAWLKDIEHHEDEACVILPDFSSTEIADFLDVLYLKCQDVSPAASKIARCLSVSNLEDNTSSTPGGKEVGVEKEQDCTPPLLKEKREELAPSFKMETEDLINRSQVEIKMEEFEKIENDEKMLGVQMKNIQNDEELFNSENFLKDIPPPNNKYDKVTKSYLLSGDRAHNQPKTKDAPSPGVNLNLLNDELGLATSAAHELVEGLTTPTHNIGGFSSGDFGLDDGGTDLDGGNAADLGSLASDANAFGHTTLGDGLKLHNNQQNNNVAVNPTSCVLSDVTQGSQLATQGNESVTQSDQAVTHSDQTVTNQRLTESNKNVTCDKVSMAHSNQTVTPSNKSVTKSVTESNTKRGPGSVQCSLCNKWLKNDRVLKNHMVIHSEPKHICDHEGCGQKFHQASNLKAHKDTVHLKKREIPCDKCGKLFYNRSTLKAHRARHGSQSFSCPHCDASFKQQRSLKNHIKTNHESSGEQSTASICQHCSKTFADQASLRRHIQRVHLQEKKFMCGQCGKSFFEKCILETHQKLHAPSSQEKDESITCDKCHVVLKNEKSWNHHMYYKHGDQVKKHVCDYCGKAFKLSYHLNRHIKLHKKEGFSCTICCKSFASEAKLNTHQLATHSRVKTEVRSQTHLQIQAKTNAAAVDRGQWFCVRCGNFVSYQHQKCSDCGELRDATLGDWFQK